MLVVTLIFGSLLAGAGWLAFVAASRRLRVHYGRSESAGRIQLIADEVRFEVELLGERLNESDTWLAMQVAGNAALYLSPTGLRTRLEEIQGRTSDTSRERMLFVRQLARALRETNLHWLRRAYRQLAVAAYELARMNSAQKPAPSTSSAVAVERKTLAELPLFVSTPLAA